MSAVQWKFELCRSSDMSVIGSLAPGKSKNLAVGLNKSGTWQTQIRGTQPIAPSISSLTTGVLAYRSPGPSVPVWSGMTWLEDDELPDDSLTASFIGWREVLNSRLLKCGVSATNPGGPTTTATTHSYGTLPGNYINADQIAVDLLNRTNAEWPTYLTPGSIDPSPGRIRTYQQFQNIGQEIDALTAIDSGFDWDVDPLTRAFNIHFKQVKANTSIYGLGTDRPNVLFGYKWGPNNISKIGRMRDGSKTKTQEIVLGKYGHAVVPDIVANGPTAQVQTYGLWQEMSSLSEVTDPNILLAYAMAQTAVLGQPQVIYNITPSPYDGTGRVPQPFVDYFIGDIIYFVSKYGRIQVPAVGDTPQPLRVFGMTFDIDDRGVERLSSIQGVAT